MKQKVSWPVTLLIVGALALVVALFYHRAASSGGEAHLSPQFMQMSPAERKAALLNAARARVSRGAR